MPNVSIPVAPPRAPPILVLGGVKDAEAHRSMFSDRFRVGWWAVSLVAVIMGMILIWMLVL